MKHKNIKCGNTYTYNKYKYKSFKKVESFKN